MPLSGNDAFTKVLLHFEGGDGSTVFTDSNAGGSAHIWTANGNAQLDAAIVKFGGGAGLFDGTGDYIDTPDHADLTLAAGDWTVDFWFNRLGGDGGARFLFGQSDSGASVASRTIEMQMSFLNKLRAVASDGSTLFTIDGTTEFLDTGWHHVAFVRTGNILRLFVDGIQEGGDLAFSGTVPDSSNKFAVGRRGEAAGSEWNGLIDEFRLSVGAARWTANFAPWNSAYDDSGATLMGQGWV